MPDQSPTAAPLRFVDDLPQSRIAERLGCSQMHVSRTLGKTLGRLREAAEAGGSDERHENQSIEGKCA